MRATTVGEALSHAAMRLQDVGVEECRLEAEALLACAAGQTRSRVLARLREPLAAGEAGRFEELMRRRLRREPLAYITGQREFYGLPFAVGAGVLIPRPETELLVDVALAACRARAVERLTLVDAGTGSGAVAVAVAAHAPGVRVIATERSGAALAYARRNVRAHGVAARVGLVRCELVEGVGDVDGIVANLPYIAEGEMAGLQPEVRDWEPREALAGGPRGPEVIERLLARAAGHLRPGAFVAVECGVGQAGGLVAFARGCFPGAEVRVRTDLAGIERVVVVDTKLRQGGDRA